MTASTRIYFSLALIIAIAIGVFSGVVSPLDEWVIAKLGSGNSSNMISFWKNVSSFGKPGFIASLTILASLGGLLIGSRRTFWFLASCGAISFVTEPVLKIIVHRPRPVELYTDTMPDSWSFPSGHAMFSMTFCLSIAYAFGVLAGRGFFWHFMDYCHRRGIVDRIVQIGIGRSLF
jgi:membrane-associated phospholipid phosphatase